MAHKLLLVELEIVVKRELSDEMSKHTHQIFMEKFQKVKIMPFNEKIYKKSQELRKRFDLGVFDSIHAATALLEDGKIASTDSAYDRVQGLTRTK